MWWLLILALILMIVIPWIIYSQVLSYPLVQVKDSKNTESTTSFLGHPSTCLCEICQIHRMFQ